MKRWKRYVNIPIEVEFYASEEDMQVHIGSIRMPSTSEVETYTRANLVFERLDDAIESAKRGGGGYCFPGWRHV